MRQVLIALFLITSMVTFGQDQIYYSDGVMKEGKVLEVSKSYLIIQEGETEYKVPKREIAVIVYANGTHEVYNKGYAKREDTREVDKTPQSLEVSQQIRRTELNQFKLNLAALTLGNVEFAYQRFFNDLIAVEFPFVVGYQDGNDDYYFRKQYSAGINLMFYPLKVTSPVQFYVGPGFDFGRGYASYEMVSDWDFYEAIPYPGYVGPYRGIYMSYISIMAKLGLSFQITDGLSSGVEVGPGLRNFVGDNGFFMPKIDLNINLKYHF